MTYLGLPTMTDWQRRIEAEVRAARAAATTGTAGLVPASSIAAVGTAWQDTHKGLVVTGGGVIGVRLWCVTGTARTRLSWSAGGVTRTSPEFETASGGFDDIELDVDEQAEDDTPVVVTVQARTVSGTAQVAVVSSWS